jgi:hypothetical protein
VGDSPAILLLFSLLVLGAGVAFWKIGKYGKRIDRHPICRQCGFDLYATIRLDYTCGECGARTYPPEGIRVGNRRMVARWVNAGGFMMAAGVLGVFFAAPSTFDVEMTARHKPAIWLRMDAVSGNADLRDAALTELLRRIANKETSANDLAPLVDKLLAIQADTAQTWIPSWGDLIEAARGKQMLDAERWQRYLDHCVSVNSGWASSWIRIHPVWRAGTAPQWSAGISGDADFGQVTLPFRATSRMQRYSDDWDTPIYAKVDQLPRLYDPRNTAIHITGQIVLIDPASHAAIATIPVDFQIDGVSGEYMRKHMLVMQIPTTRPRATTRRATSRAGTRDS